MVFPPTLDPRRPHRPPGFARWHACPVPPVRTQNARRPGARALSALALLAALTACGSAPGTADPTGVDALVVPTPSPDPADFVPRIGHRWAPWLPGSRWTYEVTGPDGTGRRVVTAERPTEVAGVPATPVRTVTEDPSGERSEVLRWYAEDRAGNLWLLGEEDRWRLGESVGSAGLAVPASPRLGDGYVAADVPGIVEETVRVAETGAEVAVPAGEYDEVVRLEVTGGGAQDQVHLAPGVGEVLRVSDGGRVRSALVSYSPGE